MRSINENQFLCCLTNYFERLVNVSPRRAKVYDARAQGKLAFHGGIGDICVAAALDGMHDPRVQLIKLGFDGASLLADAVCNSVRHCAGR